MLGWCSANPMTINNSKSRTIIFSRKTTSLSYIYRLWESDIARTDVITVF